MAILRDRLTSAPLFEGSPVEVVLAAEKLGRAEVLFDDVGLEFNPDAVLQAHQETLEVAEQTVLAPDDDEAKQRAQAALDSAPSIDDSIQNIQNALAEARARVGE